MKNEETELIRDFTTSYKKYLKDTKNDSMLFVEMESAAIRLLNYINEGFHITYKQLYEMCKSKKGEQKDESDN